jgi:cytochrome b6-f complex iron-sulfur subunit
MDNGVSNATEDLLEKKVSRRGFLEWMIGVFAVITALPVMTAVLAYLTPPGESKSSQGPVAVTDEKTLPVGSGQVFPFQDTKVLVIHAAADKWVALSAICTHAGCIVDWEGDKHIVRCPCHGGVYDLDGNVVSGPPPRPLATYGISVQNGKIMVAKA